MKNALLVQLIAGLLVIGNATGVQAFGRISIYSDAELSDCTLLDSSPRTANIYVAEWTDYCATGLRFQVAESPGFTGIWMSETSPYVTIGSSRSDLSIGFGMAIEGQFLVLTMTYQLLGTSTCSELSITPPVGFNQPICTGCIFVELPCYGYDPLHVNCSGPGACGPVATEPTTWGRVKSLYRN